MLSKVKIKSSVAAVLIVVMVLAAILAGCDYRDIVPALAGAKVDTVEKEPPSQTTEESSNTDVQEPTPTPTPAEAAAQDSSKDTVYISASKLNVREQALKDAAIVDSLMKGSAVKVLSEEKDETGAVWYNIEFSAVDGSKSGWIASEFTVKDRTELLSEELKKLDYSPQNKTYEYPNNPRVEAKGIYMTIYSASNSRLDELIEMTKRTSINAFVIDVKDDNGHMLFETEAAAKYSPDANKKATIKDIKAFMQKLKDNNIYAIARIVSFKDPTYTKHHPDRAIIYRDSGKVFTNSDKLAWASAHDRELWDYNIAVAKEAAAAGFNEIQFDYVRFPASNGGKLDKQLDYRNAKGESKPETIQNYLKYAREQLSPMQVYISADIYGLVGSVADDMALGQYWEAVSNIVDYVCPMMYPSHYANGTYGLSVPDAYPYETIYNSIKDSVARNKNIETPGTIRPWIQDFTAPWVKGYIKYGDKQVEDQIRALEENGVKEFLLWNAGNKYSEGAVAK
ncbi:MAG: putative glycoside hydrolase [Bacillota bacterium]